MNSLAVTENKVNSHDLKKEKIFQKTAGTNLDYTEIIVKVAQFGRNYHLKVEAQADYKHIGGVPKEFTLKLRSGKNLMGKVKESGDYKEYLFINSNWLIHCYKDKRGIYTNEETYRWISLTNNPHEFIFPWRVGLKMTEGGKLIGWLWEMKQKQGWDLLIKKDYWNPENYNVYPRGFQLAEPTHSSDSDDQDPEIVLTKGEKLLIQSRKEVFIREKKGELVLFIGDHYSNPDNIYDEYRLQPKGEDEFGVDVDELDLRLLTDYANEVDFEKKYGKK